MRSIAWGAVLACALRHPGTAPRLLVLVCRYGGRRARLWLALRRAGIPLREAILLNRRPD